MPSSVAVKRQIFGPADRGVIGDWPASIRAHTPGRRVPGTSRFVPRPRSRGRPYARQSPEGVGTFQSTPLRWGDTIATWFPTAITYLPAASRRKPAQKLSSDSDATGSSA